MSLYFRVRKRVFDSVPPVGCKSHVRRTKRRYSPHPAGTMTQHLHSQLLRPSHLCCHNLHRPFSTATTHPWQARARTRCSSASSNQNS